MLPNKLRQLSFLFLGALILSFLVIGPADSLTVDEIIKLKNAGVSDEIIKQMIEKEGKGQPNSKTTVTIWNKSRCRLLRVGKSEPECFEFSFSGQGVQNSSYIDKTTNWNPIEIKPGEYTIIYYDIYGRGSIENKFRFSARDGDKVDIYFDTHASFSNTICTLNVFVNNQRIFRKYLEASTYACD